jgi:hypothetical protein
MLHKQLKVTTSKRTEMRKLQEEIKYTNEEMVRKISQRGGKGWGGGRRQREKTT